MNEAIKNQWLSALRSGKYTQGVSQLRSLKNEYCCMGVLCDIVDHKKWKGVQAVGAFTFEGRSGYPPSTVWDSAGIPQVAFQHEKIPDGRVIPSILQHMNDSEYRTFPEIADWIEENL